MNLYILEIIVKFLRMLFVAIVSLFGTGLYTENVSVTDNNIISKKEYAINTVYIEQKPAENKTNINETNITKKEVVLQPVTPTNNILTTEEPTVVPVDKTIETFTGRLTGYGPDCAGCSGSGGVACRPKNGSSWSLNSNGIYYNDDEYGKVRILAAATSKFTCGTIINVTTPGQEPFTAVVLDTGGSMRKAWSEGSVWMDLAYQSEASTGSDSLTGYNVKFDVQRYGW